MATIQDIAKKAGVSAATVSRVLNYDAKISVSCETKQAIFQAAKDLGYQKKNVYPPISDVALLYWPVHQEEIEETYYKTILTKLESQASDRNIKITLYNKAESNPLAKTHGPLSRSAGLTPMNWIFSNRLPQTAFSSTVLPTISALTRCSPISTPSLSRW